MSRGINKVILIGLLGKDPIVTYLPNGDAVTKFSLATGEYWKNAQGEKQERTEWHNIVMFRKLAEVAGEYLKKGAKVYLTGKIRQQTWVDKETGKNCYRTEIHADELQMLDGKRDGQDNHSNHSNHCAEMPPTSDGFYNDDIPF